jgi:hypothetical protein
MDEVWDGIEALTGRALYTLPDRVAFQVVSVNRSKRPAIQIRAPIPKSRVAGSHA